VQDETVKLGVSGMELVVDGVGTQQRAYLPVKCAERASLA
jgi:hypothetical protein